MIKTLPVNVSGRDFVVGDLHGSFDLFTTFTNFINFDPRVDRIISVGDLIDRGPKSLECLQLLNNDWFHCVKANHEQLMEDYLTGGPTGSWWFHNGGDWWLDVSTDEKEIINDLLLVVQKLPWIVTVNMQNGKKFHVIHAELWAKRGAEIIDSDLESKTLFKVFALTNMGDGEAALWGRDLWGSLYASHMDDTKIRKFRKSLEFKKPYFNKALSHIYSGHTTMRQPTTIGGQTNLDTGAFRTLRDDEWAGLTFTEPLTNKFWTVKKDGVHEVQPLVI